MYLTVLKTGHRLTHETPLLIEGVWDARGNKNIPCVITFPDGKTDEITLTHLDLKEVLFSGKITNNVSKEEPPFPAVQNLPYIIPSTISTVSQQPTFKPDNELEDNELNLENIGPPHPNLPEGWSDTESNPGEYFVFGKHKEAKLRLDGSKGIGSEKTLEHFFGYVKWYNEHKCMNRGYRRLRRMDPFKLFDVEAYQELPF